MWKSDYNTEENENSQKLGYLFSFTSAFFAACATVTGKWNLDYISPLMMNAFIFSIATAIMSVVYLPFRRVKSNILIFTKAGYIWLMAFTASSVLAIWFFWAGVQRMDPSLAAFLNRSEVLIAILCGVIFLGERFNRLETFGGILSIAGIVIMRAYLRVEYSTGFWLVLVGSFFFGLTEFFSKMAVRYGRPIIITYLRNLMMSVVYWIILSSLNPDFSGLKTVWPGVIALGVFGPIFSRMIYMTALQHLELSKVAIISQTQPIYVVLIAATILGQMPTFREIMGGLFLTVGCLIMVLGRSRKIKKPAPPK